MARPKRILSEQEKNLTVVLYELGHTDEEVADVMKMPRKTLAGCLKYNDLTAIIKKAKGTANTKVEISLYKKAREGNIVAMIFWLCNRNPERWKNVQRTEALHKVEFDPAKEVEIKITPQDLE